MNIHVHRKTMLAPFIICYVSSNPGIMKFVINLITYNPLNAYTLILSFIDQIMFSTKPIKS